MGILHVHGSRGRLGSRVMALTTLMLCGVLTATAAERMVVAENFTNTG